MTRSYFVPPLAGALALALGCPAMAQMGTTTFNDPPRTVAAPDYDSGIQAGTLSDSNFNTPESDGRPGVYFFELGSKAFRDKDYRHAVDMFKVAASWAYKPAEYDLGLMYFKGQGVPLDRSLGAAWMVLAAERGEPMYVHARNTMVTLLSDSEFARTDELWRQLSATFSDRVALRRAKAQWAWVRTHKTGTRAGGAAGELAVGVLDSGHAPRPLDSSGRSATTLTNGFGIMQSGSVDGALAYREFEQSDNPYDPVFQKNRTGEATVGPLAPVEPGDAASPKQGGTGHNF